MKSVFTVIYVVLTGILLACFSPLFLLVYAGNFARRHGCLVNEGTVNSCVVDGTDHGEWLYQSTVAAWYMLLTMPIALLVLIALLITRILHRRSLRKSAG